ncbi:MAG: hypothetical protein IPK82_21270 [Polyangiaceae bacterium]|nr:hypothetical protein [Polyangiaceae bacterium]
MRRAQFGAVSVLFAGLSACGPAVVTPTVQTAPVEVAPPTTASASATEAVEAAPIADPTDVVGIARWRNPLQSVSNLASCGGVAPVLVEVNARLMVSEVLREFIRGGGVDTRKLAGVIAVDAPVDMIVTLDPEERPRPPLFAVAAGLSSLDGARAAVDPEGKMTEVSPGTWQLKNARGAVCWISTAVGPSPARLVCSHNAKSLNALGPYLTRSAPLKDWGGPDIHVEARMNVAQKRYGQTFKNMLRVLPDTVVAEVGSGDARVDQALFNMATSVQEDIPKILADTQNIVSEVTTNRSGTCLRSNTEFEFATKTSWFAQAMTDRLDRAAAPPSIYWRAPKDADSAMYGRGADPALYTNMIAQFRGLFDGVLAAEGVNAADRKRLTDLISAPYGKNTNMVWAHGTLPASFPQKGSKDEGKKLVEAGFTSLAGWNLFGMDEGPAALKKQLKDFIEAYKAPGIQTGFKKMLGSDSKHLPTVKSIPAPAALGAGSEGLEITIPNVEAPNPGDAATKKPATMSLKLYVFLMLDGDNTWLAIGAAKDELVKRLQTTKVGASDKDQLASRSDLESLRTGKQMFGGFFSAGMITNGIATSIQALEQMDESGTPSELKQLTSALTALPNKGKTPIFVTGTGAETSTGSKVGLTVEVQQGTFEDSRALVVSGYSFFRSLGLLP